MRSLIIPHHPNYFHFITERLTGVGKVHAEDPDLGLFCVGPYVDLLRPFSPYPIRLTQDAPPGTPKLSRDEYGRIEPEQCRLAEKIIKYFSPVAGRECITIVARSRYRKWLDLSGLLAKVKLQFADIECQAVTLEILSIPEQLQLMQRTKLLVAVHGAGLTNAMFMRKGASVIEVFPYAFHSEDYPRFCSRALLHHWELEAEPSPGCDFDQLPEEVKDLIAGRCLTKQIYTEIHEAYLEGRVKLRDRWKVDKLLRDAEYVPIDLNVVCDTMLEAWKASEIA